MTWLNIARPQRANFLDAATLSAKTEQRTWILGSSEVWRMGYSTDLAATFSGTGPVPTIKPYFNSTTMHHMFIKVSHCLFTPLWHFCSLVLTFHVASPLAVGFSGSPWEKKTPSNSNHSRLSVLWCHAHFCAADSQAEFWTLFKLPLSEEWDAMGLLAAMLKI